MAPEVLLFSHELLVLQPCQVLGPVVPDLCDPEPGSGGWRPGDWKCLWPAQDLQLSSKCVCNQELRSRAELELLLVSAAWLLQVARHRYSDPKASLRKSFLSGISTAKHVPHSTALGDLKHWKSTVRHQWGEGNEQARFGIGRPARLMKDSSCPRIKWDANLERVGLWSQEVYGESQLLLACVQ